MTTRGATGEELGAHGLRTQLVMAVVTLAAIGGFVLWQVWPSGDETVVPVARSTASSRATADAAPMGGLAEQRPADQRARGARRAAATPPRFFIVESEERALAFRAAIDEENALRRTQGQPPLTAQVLWFDSAEAVSQLLQTVYVQGALELSYISIIDLRGRSLASCFEQEATIPDVVRETCSTESTVQTTYLVDSTAEQRALTDLGLGAHERVLVVTTDEDATQVRLVQERPGVSVIDLRRR